MRKGIAITLDALFAVLVVIVIGVLLLFFTRSTSYHIEQSYGVARDFLTIPQSVRLIELQNSTYSNISAMVNCSVFNTSCYCKLENMENNILEAMGEFWSMNRTNCSEMIAREYFNSSIPPDFGFEITLRDTKGNTDVIFRRDREYKKLIVPERRIISGVEREAPTIGWSARAYIITMKKQTASYVYFGGYEGDGNITKTMYLPDNIDVTNASMELDVKYNFSLYINNQYAGYYTPTVQTNLSSNKFNIPDYILFQSGYNNITYYFNASNGTGYVGGGYIIVYYNTTYPILESIVPAGQESSRYTYLPGINGIINLYSGFDFPGEAKNLEIYLHYLSNYSVFFYMGNEKVYSSSSQGEQKVNITAFLTNISTLSNKTVPIRFGTDVPTETVTISGSIADVVLVTDNSGSMDWQMESSSAGTQRECSDALINDSSTQRVSLAKCIDIKFVNDVLKSTGSRVGLVNYNDNLISTHALSDDNFSLIQDVDDYFANSGTCICCGLNAAINVMSGENIAIQRGSSWRYYTKTNCGAGCDPLNSLCALPANWNLQTFDDSSWPSIATRNSFGEKRVRIYRRNFSLSSIPSYGIFNIYDRDGATCYLNGNLIGNETTCGGGSYWDNTWTIANTSFVIGNNTLACAVRSTSLSTGYFNAELRTYSLPDPSKRKYVVLMSDGIAGYYCGGQCNGFNTTGYYSCDGNTADCDNFAGCGCAIRNANESAYKAAALNITIISVGFGPVGGCETGNHTLQSVANITGGFYIWGKNATDLWNAFDNITGFILNASYAEQSIQVLGNANYSNYLYPDSYVKITYVPQETLYYGEITLTREAGRFSEYSGTGVQNPKEVAYNISNSTRVIYSYVTSYSSNYWTYSVDAGPAGLWNPVFRLADYGSNYTALGDPFHLYLPSPLFEEGTENHIRLTTANYLGQTVGGSPDSRGIFTYAIKGYVPYGLVFPNADGCNKTIWYDLNGDGIADGNSTVVFGNGSCSNDAKYDALQRLLKNLISVNRGGEIGSQTNPIDIEIGKDVGFEVVESRGIPYMWGPAVLELKIWK